MAGIYIHIPFCKQACHYCDFHFSTSLKYKEDFLKALKREIELQKNYLLPPHSVDRLADVSTIYFGGGTPSLLSQSELMEIIETLHRNFNIDKNAEITLEANPDDLTNLKIKELKDTPINRFSIGIQSFYDEDLKLMNRAHNSKEAEHSVKCAQDHGFENITIDLIYGIQTLTDRNWKNNLQTAFDLDVKHISAYCLTVEPKTALAKFVKEGKLKEVDEQQSAEQFEIMLEAMKNNDFVQYEISNFCKENFYSKHNSNYWLKEKYLGLGPSAHSYNGEVRHANIANNALYIQSLSENKLNVEEEKLSPVQSYNEYVLTSLRTMWGTDLDHIRKNYGDELVIFCLAEAEKHIASGDVLKKGNKLFLSDKGKLFADRIAGALFKIVY